MSDADKSAAFQRIRAMYRKHAERGVVLRDDDLGYYLGTHEVRAKDGYRTAFGGVEIKKNYVSAHVMPVYVHADLAEGLGDALRKRMQGKSCFNFKRVEEPLFDELERIIDIGADRFAADGRLS